MTYPNIAAELARNSMSQAELAKHLNVCRKTLWNWEHKGNIPLKKLEAMSKLFGVSTDYLLGREVKPQ